jgi:hypothetical protein
VQTEESVGKNPASNLLRHKSGRYYARGFAGGKEVWKSLQTTDFSVPESKLMRFPEEHQEYRSDGNGNGQVSANSGH